MAQFIVRIELHNAKTGEDYKQQLHLLMKNNGFLQTVISNEKKVYHLPTAEYNKEGNYDINLIFQSANDAASKSGFKFSILVIEANRLMWDGLPQQ